MLFFHARKICLFSDLALPSYLYTSQLTSFLTVFPAAVSSSSSSAQRLFICIDWYLFKTDCSFFSLLYTQPPSPSLPCISSSLSHVAPDHYSWACKAQKRTCPPMVLARVQALKYGCVSVTLESSAADPIYFKRYPRCLTEVRPRFSGALLPISHILLLLAFYYSRTGFGFWYIHPNN